MYENLNKILNSAFLVILLLVPQLFRETKQFQAIISNETSAIVDELQKQNIVMGRAIGDGGERPKQYDNFIKLKSTATIDELLALTNHKNPVVRCYLFWALSYHHLVDLKPIIYSHITDDEEVATMFGCFSLNEKVGDFFINTVTYGSFDLKTKKLDSAQFTILDSILINTQNNLFARSRAIRRSKQST
ncbi:MAG: hypothetical protein Kapaf2KO_01750 [Candidatus Kapaibacteriales bacterium]